MVDMMKERGELREKATRLEQQLDEAVHPMGVVVKLSESELKRKREHEETCDQKRRMNTEMFTESITHGRIEIPGGALMEVWHPQETDPSRWQRLRPSCT